MAATSPLILDIDGGVLPLPGSESVALTEWREDLRFGCGFATLGRFAERIRTIQTGGRTAFIGSGDFHHLSHLLVGRWSVEAPGLHVVVLDNHPDNMRYPWGIHCGSWVTHTARLPFVAAVHVLGIASTDVELAHAWENRLGPLRAGKLHYWCVGRDVAWTRRIGIATVRSWPTAAAMVEAFVAHIEATHGPCYLSIDKDVLSTATVRTNWDQGVMTLAELGRVICSIRSRLVASDVTGDVSHHRYRSRWKRLLSAIDGQPAVAEGDLHRWQAAHRQINLQILEWLRPR